MSTYSVETRSDNCAIIATVTPDYNPHTDMPNLVDQLEAILDASAQRLTLIFEFTHLNLNMEDFLKATQDSLRGAGARIVRHPKIKTSIIVSPNPIWHMTAKGFRSEAFGKLKVYAFNTVDEALSYIREILCSPLNVSDPINMSDPLNVSAPIPASAEQAKPDQDLRPTT